MENLIDPICEYCENREISCITPCAPILWINGNTPGKEPLLSDLRASYREYTTDYKTILADLITDRESALDKLVKVKNIRKRAIISMLIADISRQDIADLLSMSYRQIGRILNKDKQSSPSKTLKMSETAS